MSRAYFASHHAEPLSEEVIRVLRRAKKGGMTYRSMANACGISDATLDRAMSGFPLKERTIQNIWLFARTWQNEHEKGAAA